MTKHNDTFWDVNRNRDHKDWIPTDIKELELEIKRLQSEGTDPSRLQLCENLYERLSKKEQTKS
jgi:hypothetical protein